MRALCRFCAEAFADVLSGTSGRGGYPGTLPIGRGRSTVDNAKIFKQFLENPRNLGEKSISESENDPWLKETFEVFILEMRILRGDDTRSDSDDNDDRVR